MSAPITEAHRELAHEIVFHMVHENGDKAAQLIADSEAKAVVEIAMVAAASADCNVSLRLERDQLRAKLEVANHSIVSYLLYNTLKEKHDKLSAEAYDTDGTPWKTVCGWWSKKYDAVERQMCENAARAERAEAEVQRLKSDGAASAFIAMSCRASRAETDRNNLRADLDAIKAILTEEKARAERAEAELADERARLDWLEDNSVCYHVCIDRQPDGYSIHNSPPSPGSVRAAIDAAMKEGAKS
jgi:hypothetical protein